MPSETKPPAAAIQLVSEGHQTGGSASDPAGTVAITLTTIIGEQQQNHSNRVRDRTRSRGAAIIEQQSSSQKERERDKKERPQGKKYKEARTWSR
jgi:hypothetical protein